MTFGKRIYLIIKRLFDLILAALLILLLSPVMAAAAVAVRLDTEGPVLFRQKRAGKGCRIFAIRKFRTMRIETERNGRPLSDMERMTGVGRFLRRTSIDELPQLFNILKGEMSFIGPRPLLVQYLELYSDEQRRRHDVMPGISGWAQVNGRNATTWAERFGYDVFYADNASLLLDLRIIFMTVASLFSRKGVEFSDTETMPFFCGNLRGH